MNTYRRFTAAAGSAALNVVLVLILSQGAAAATPATKEPAAAPQSHTIDQGADHHDSNERCVARLRTRAIIAMLLAMVV